MATPTRCPRCVRENRAPSLLFQQEPEPTPEEVAATEAHDAWWNDPNNQERIALEAEEKRLEDARRAKLAPLAERHGSTVIRCGCGTLGVKGLRHPPGNDIENGPTHVIDERFGYCKHDKPEQDCAECAGYWCEACGDTFHPETS